MEYTIESILKSFERDIQWHSEQLKNHEENTPSWNFHLGWVDALTSYRYKLEAVE